MSELEKVYLRLPVWLQNVAINGQGWLINRQRYGKSFKRVLREYKQREFDGPDALAEYRDRRLRNLLCQAVRTIPFYRDMLRSAGCDVADVQTLADLSRLPQLDKAWIQEHQEHLTSQEVRRQDIVIHHTSGSTGAGLRFPTTRAAMDEQWAVWWRYRESHGIDRDEKCLYFGGRSIVPLQQTKPPFWRYNLAGRQLLFSGYHLSPATARAYLEEIRRSKLRWIHGYPSVVSLLGQYAIELGMQTPMRWVTTGAEGLLANQRAVIREAFAVAPVQNYGMSEGVANFSECPAGNLHVDEDYAAVEFVPVEQQDAYRVVGTSLTNLAFPFIRYDVGDIVRLSNESCDCGRHGRLVAAIDGRSEDFVVLKNGARLGRLDHIFKDCVNVKEAQLFQSEIGRLAVRVVKGKNYSADDEQQLRDEIQRRVADFLDVEIVYVDQVERTSLGKLRFVVSTVGQADPSAD